ncbi:hypothetical protein ACIQU4_38875 [Streptomyces sp. NPDC090741]|uniref:hypothetical protein n=1 Tax=Streptomyces sp. NPDC090741 TaxID=3365967 RepID=UPI003822070D
MAGPFQFLLREVQLLGERSHLGGGGRHFAECGDLVLEAGDQAHQQQYQLLGADTVFLQL